jgi:hypothetical protein
MCSAVSGENRNMVQRDCSRNQRNQHLVGLVSVVMILACLDETDLDMYMIIVTCHRIHTYEERICDGRFHARFSPGNLRLRAGSEERNGAEELTCSAGMILFT